MISQSCVVLQILFVVGFHLFHTLQEVRVRSTYSSKALLQLEASFSGCGQAIIGHVAKLALVIQFYNLPTQICNLIPGIIQTLLELKAGDVDLRELIIIARFSFFPGGDLSLQIGEFILQGYIVSNWPEIAGIQSPVGLRNP